MSPHFSLRDLLDGMTEGVEVPDLPVPGLATNSKQVRPGDVFFALPGEGTHGLHFANEAEQRGAAAVVWDDDKSTATGTVPYIRVTELRERTGYIASRFFGNPSADMTVVAITGTNGKTTVAHVTAQALKMRHGACGLFGTLGLGAIGDLKPSPNTTPDALLIQSTLADLHANGIRHAVIEASSHGLSQHRLAGVGVDIAVLTQLGRDHLDYHLTPETYAASKKKLFEKDGVKAAVLNVDDPFGAELSGFCESRGIQVTGYSLRESETAAVTGKVNAFGCDGIDMEVTSEGGTAGLKSRLVGLFNASNLLASFAVLLETGCDADTAAALLSSVSPVPGRMQLFRSDEQPLVILDYAHTPDAMESVLLLSRTMCGGEIVCVFGCGGERDPGKRPLMGGIAARLSDRVVLTDDNPRHEPPQNIISDIAAGIGKKNYAETVTIHRRDRAIKYAIENMSPRDCVLVLGKGHEHTQDFGDHTEAFSDAEVIRNVLAGCAVDLCDADGAGT